MAQASGGFAPPTMLITDPVDYICFVDIDFWTENPFGNSGIRVFGSIKIVISTLEPRTFENLEPNLINPNT